jgi:hypothetical protein
MRLLTRYRQVSIRGRMGEGRRLLFRIVVGRVRRRGVRVVVGVAVRRVLEQPGGVV